MSETFAYVPTKEVRKSITPRVKSVTFGNGFMQIAPDGINSVLEEWSLTFTVIDADRIIIDAFFTSMLGCTPFIWKSSEVGALNKYYLCPSWQVTPVGGCYFTITSTFKQWAGLYEDDINPPAPDPDALIMESDLVMEDDLVMS